jgi:hypothetical protein
MLRLSHRAELFIFLAARFRTVFLRVYARAQLNRL